MRLNIYNLQSTVFDGETSSVSLPTESGEIAVLPHHIPLVTTLQKGKIISRYKNDKKEFSVTGGVMYTDGIQLVVLAD